MTPSVVPAREPYAAGRGAPPARGPRSLPGNPERTGGADVSASPVHRARSARAAARGVAA
ncbi:hypothetical protein EES47_06260 [Streptomyces sp. ADI98-12]|uniref:Uncharacterized protein n=1 Tax=Streptomyces griseus TaxID=1911 RepID=A0A380P9X0_STRGR|nr:hypothetical protein [Streptomyces sp. DSM 41037]RPK91298.1 hypothetical protein EES47_06260 [Streptomyces sp. ADI98-12]GFH65236.1 hypothetical protein Srut_17500 [Streptomyces rutgersensis]SUP62031.1 Uncharacterised protein [Streptomyces griseus]